MVNKNGSLTALFLALLMASSALAATRIQVLAVEKRKVLKLYRDIPNTELNRSVAYLRNTFVDDETPNMYIPPFCSAEPGKEDKELESHEPIGSVKPLCKYKLVFLRYEDKMYTLTVCPITTYKQLRAHAARRLNLANPEFKLSADDIAFDGIVNEKDAIPGLNDAAPNHHLFYQPGDPFLSVVKREKKRPARLKLAQLTGTSVEVDIPKIGPCSIDNVDVDKWTVGQLRSAIEAKFGADANHHKSMAFCKANGDEAEDKDLLTTVFIDSNRLPVTTISVVDWTTGEKKEHKMAYCRNSTFKQVLSRALPSWKATVEGGSMVSVFKVTKKDDESKDDGPNNAAAPTSLGDTITKSAPADTDIYYTTTEGALLVTVMGKRICLPKGYRSTVSDVRQALIKEVGHLKAWQFAFCLDDHEMLPTDFIPNEAALTSVRTSIGRGFVKTPARSVLAVIEDEPKESRSYPMHVCANSNFGDLERRMHGLLKLSPEDVVKFSCLDATGFVALGNMAANLSTEPRPLIATINQDTPSTLTLKQPWIQPYFGTFNPFNGLLVGDVGYPLQRVDPQMTVGELRSKIIEMGAVDEERMKRFPFCVPNIGGNPHSGLEMDDNSTFAQYGLTGGAGVNYEFRTEKAWFVDWTRAAEQGLSAEERLVDVCPRSTYGQVAARSVADRHIYTHTKKDINIIVEDAKPPNKDDRRKSFVVSSGRRLDAVVLHNPLAADNKDASKIYMLPKRMAIVTVGDKMFPVKDPNSVNVGVIRDAFVKKDGNKAHKMAFCADNLAFWNVKEMDENRSFAYYGILPDSWTKLCKPGKVPIAFTVDGREDFVEMEYCPYTTPEDLKYRLMMYTRVDPSCSLTIGPAKLVDYPSFLLWSGSGDTNFMPASLVATITSPAYQLELKAAKPIDSQRRLAQIKGEGPVKPSKVDMPPVPTKSDAARLIAALQIPTNLDDPQVLVFK